MINTGDYIETHKTMAYLDERYDILRIQMTNNAANADQEVTLFSNTATNLLTSSTFRTGLSTNMEVTTAHAFSGGIYDSVNNQIAVVHNSSDYQAVSGNPVLEVFNATTGALVGSVDLGTGYTEGVTYVSSIDEYWITRQTSNAFIERIDATTLATAGQVSIGGGTEAWDIIYSAAQDLIYVMGGSDNVVYVYDTTGTLSTTIAGWTYAVKYAVLVDSQNALYVSQREESLVYNVDTVSNTKGDPVSAFIDMTIGFYDSTLGLVFVGSSQAAKIYAFDPTTDTVSYSDTLNTTSGRVRGISSIASDGEVQFLVSQTIDASNETLIIETYSSTLTYETSLTVATADTPLGHNHAVYNGANDDTWVFYKPDTANALFEEFDTRKVLDDEDSEQGSVSITGNHLKTIYEILQSPFRIDHIKMIMSGDRQPYELINYLQDTAEGRCIRKYYHPSNYIPATGKTNAVADIMLPEPIILDSNHEIKYTIKGGETVTMYIYFLRVDPKDFFIDRTAYPDRSIKGRYVL